MLEFVVRAAVVGIGATALMDLWGWFLKRMFAIPPLDYAWVGRWIGHFPHGRFAHANIAQAARVRGETAIGYRHWMECALRDRHRICRSADWSVGPRLGTAPDSASGPVGRRLHHRRPIFVMQPAFGIGIAASKVPNPRTARLRSLMAHLSFGVGLYVAASLSALLLPA
ncbi:DUF2938 family protein [Mesorhizobium sp. M0998]|uniref:DUF2938 family protein n=1 Tax=Mesorhizobium sp. M0998 TaxID=2957044 RepID=UPI003339D298